MISVGQLTDFALRQLGEDPDDPALDEIVFDWINTIKDHVTSWCQWDWLSAWGQISVPASGILYFPDYVGCILSMFPLGIGYRRPVDLIGAAQFDQAGPGVSGGLPDFMIRWGIYGVMADNPTLGPISFVSSAGVGDQGLQLTVEGLDANRFALEKTVTLGAVGTASTVNSFLGEVDGVRLIYVNHSSRAGKTLGLVTASGAGTELVRLNTSKELHREHGRAEIYPTQTGMYAYRYYKRVPDVIARDQVIQVPREYKDTFYEGMKWQVRDFQGFPEQGLIYYNQMNKRLEDLKYQLARQPGRRHGITPSQAYRHRPWKW